jgi:hypothetical protein
LTFLYHIRLSTHFSHIPQSVSEKATCNFAEQNVLFHAVLLL